MLIRLFVLTLAIILPCLGLAQPLSFQKIHHTNFFTHCYHITSTPDNGYLVTGFEDRPAPNSTPLVPYFAKLNCAGEVEWRRKYGDATTVNNTSPRVAVLPDGNYVMMTTIIGNNNDILVVKTTPAGTASWKKLYGGFFHDVGRGMTTLSDTSIVVVGMTESFGPDANSVWHDAYILKLDGATGDTVWTKVIGNVQSADDAWMVTENELGGVTFCGRTFHNGGVWMLIYKLDANGNTVVKKLIGETNHDSQGYDILRLQDNGYIITGTTTLAKTDFSSLTDVVVVRTDSAGDPIWTNVIHSSNNDLADLSSSVVMKGDTVVIAYETDGYPTVGSDGSKRCLATLDLTTGSLTSAKKFGIEGGQFPHITADQNGFALSTMTDEYPGNWYDPVIIKTDRNLNSGCLEFDLTSLTIEENPTFTVTNISFQETHGAFTNNYTPDSIAAPWSDSAFCENRAPLQVDWDYEAEECREDSVVFRATITDSTYLDLIWDFGDGSGPVPEPDTTHDYDSTGTYTVTLTVTYCDTIVEVTKTVDLPECPDVEIQNFFTPNGDGINDIFLPNARGIRITEFKIFDRWGRLLFESEDGEQGWDGTQNGSELKPGVYYYTIEMLYSAGEKFVKKAGSVVLMR